MRYANTNRCLLAAVLSVGLCGSAVVAEEFKEEFHQTYPLAAEGRFSIENVNGRIEISGWDRDEVDVKAVKHGASRESVEATKIEVKAGSDRLSVEAALPRSGFWSRNDSVTIDYTIRLPQRARIEKAEGVNGDVVIESVAGDVRASTVNGEVRTKGTKGNVKLSTVNGGIKTELGSLGDHQSVSLETVNGGIVASLPPGADTEVSASTVNGGISSEHASLIVKKDFPVGSNLKGTLGKGGARVKASTVNGGIDIRKSGSPL